MGKVRPDHKVAIIPNDGFRTTGIRTGVNIETFPENIAFPDTDAHRTPLCLES